MKPLLKGKRWAASIDAMVPAGSHLYAATKGFGGVEIWRRARGRVDPCLVRPELCGL